MDDDELTRLAIKLLEKEGQRFVRERALTKPGPLKTNKAFLRAQLQHNEISNRRINGQSETSELTVEPQVNKPKKKPSQNGSASHTNYHLMPSKRHMFNRNCLKNKSHVSKLTKDLKVSFKFQLKGKSLKTSNDAHNGEKDTEDNRTNIDDLESDIDTVVKTPEEAHDIDAMTTTEEIINISDNDSVISVSSSPDRSRRKKPRKARDDKPIKTKRKCKH